MKTLIHGRSDELRRFHWWSVVVVLFFAMLTFGKLLRASPITFGCDAEVTNVLITPSPDFNVPFEVHAGDTIHGRFTFEPSPIGHLGSQDFGLEFEIGGSTLATSTYEILAALNQPTRPPSDLIDQLSVDCFFTPGASQCTPGTVLAPPVRDGGLFWT